MAQSQLRKGEIGKSGTYTSGGYIQLEEYNLDLAGKRGLKIWDEMRRGDATVAAALRVCKLPIMSAPWGVQAASEDDADKEVSEFVRKNFFELLDWESTLQEILTFFEFGYGVHEMVFEPGTIDGKLRIVLSKVAFRKQSTIDRWETEDKRPGVLQVINTGDKYSIPEEKLLYFANQQEGDNREGISLLRGAYKHWYMKDKYYLIDAVGFERHALGIIRITPPPSASPADINKMEIAARQARASEEAFIRADKDWGFEFMDMKAASLKDPKEAIAHHDRQIAKNVLAQFLELGASGGSGSRSLSEDHTKLFEQAEQAVANYIAKVMRKAIKALVDLNFTVTSYPKLTPGKIGDDNLVEVSDAISKFVTAQAIHPRPEDENYFRKIIGMPELSEDDLEAMKAEREAQASKKPAGRTEEAEDQDDTAPGEANKASVVDAEARRLHATLTRQLYEDSGRAA